MASRRIDPALAAKLRFKSFLSRMKLLGAYEAMPSVLRAQMFDVRAPEPQLVFDPSFPRVDPQGRSTQPLREKIEAGFKSASVDAGALTMNLVDYFSLAPGMLRFARSVTNPARGWTAAQSGDPPLPPCVMTFAECAQPILEALLEHRFQAALFDDLHLRAFTPLLQQSRLDGTLLYGTATSEKTRCGVRLVVSIHGQKAQTNYIALDGVRRPVHPVVDVNTWFGPQPVCWSGRSLGPEWARQLGLGEEEVVPVYVQSHALEQLKARLDLESYRPFAQTWMVSALREPVIAERQPDGDLLVTFKLHDYRVGYLVVSPVLKKENRSPAKGNPSLAKVNPSLAKGRSSIEAFIVRTFLFLTMQRTPEGKGLEKRLGLTRAEIDYLGLHEMSRFLRTDLKEDAKLRALLSACGCGHLFELAEEEESDLWRCPARGTPLEEPMIKPFAAELRQYVGLDQAEAA